MRPTGIICPNCGAKLRVLQTRTTIAITGISVGTLFALLLASNLRLGGGSQYLSALLAAGALFGLPHYLAPRLAQMRVLDIDEKVDFPLARSPAPLEETEPSEHEVPSDAGPSWTCAHCHEENEGNFEICWKCQADRPT